MFYQLAVFPPVSLLLNCFAADPDQFSADQRVWSGYHCRWTPVDKRNNALTMKEDVEYSCHPDAALCATPRPSLVLGAMELKGDETGAVDQKDLFKCTALTTITAVTLMTETLAEQVVVPFVTNVKGEAFLYVTMMKRDMQPPLVEFFGTACISQSVGGQEERVKFIATLAVLLHKICKLLPTGEARMFLGLLKTRGAVPSNRSEDVSSSADPRTASRSRKRSRADAYSADAAEVASAGGKVANLANIGSYRHEGSPYYFVGNYGGNGGQMVPVFLKVWLQEGKSALRRRTQSETELLQLAHREGGRCPEVISQLTAMSIDHAGSTYHRLVMRKLANDPLGPEDLERFAESLIEAVLALHRAGILHCDLKPSNVAWSAATETAYLVDFGLAQLEYGAKAYTGTDGYTNPWVARKDEPHSRLSDAYSVGKTILEAGRRTVNKIQRCALQEDSSRASWIHVAEALSREDLCSRLTLEQVRDELRRAGLSSFSVPTRTESLTAVSGDPTAAGQPQLLTQEAEPPADLATVVSPDLQAAKG